MATPILFFFLPLALFFVSLFVIRLLWVRWRERGLSFRGPALTGTARISGVDSEYYGHSFVTKMWCRIGLTVDVPGYQPYDAVVEAVVPRQAAVDDLEGRIVAVQVDSANLQRVRIDFNEPPPGQHDGPPGDYLGFKKTQGDTRRTYMIAYTAALIIVVILFIAFYRTVG
jgi:hypothetical protein